MKSLLEFITDRENIPKREDIPKRESQSSAEAVKEYFQNNSLEECPNCHEKTLIHQGGCIQCNSCGYSKCS